MLHTVSHEQGQGQVPGKVEQPQQQPGAQQALEIQKTEEVESHKYRNVFNSCAVAMVSVTHALHKISTLSLFH